MELGKHTDATCNMRSILDFHIWSRIILRLTISHYCLGLLYTYDKLEMTAKWGKSEIEENENNFVRHHCYITAVQRVV